MLDELKSGPWSSFISGTKNLRDRHSNQGINSVANDLLGQLEYSYETRKGYWKGGTIIFFAMVPGSFPVSQKSASNSRIPRNSIP